MRRRAFLAALSAGLAGCSLGPSETPTLTPAPGVDATPTSTPTETPDDDDSLGGLGAASLVDLATGPRTLALSPPSWSGYDGAAVEARFVAPSTPDHPARLRATLTNDNDWSNTFRLDEVPPFMEINRADLPELHEEARESGLYLAPTADHDLVDTDPTVERGPEGYWRATDLPPKLPRTVRLSPDESIRGEYLLVGHPERRGFPTGTYRFGHDGSFSIAAWHTREPGPRGASRFEGRDVPSLPGEAPTPWYHEAGTTTPVFLRPSTERLAAPGEVSFSLVNHSREALGGNPYDWTLYKLVDGSWYHVAPWAIPMPASAVPPGETWEYTLRAFHERFHGEGWDEGQTVSRLGGGTYAFEAGFAPDGSATPAALFDLVAPEVTAAPPEGPTVERSGKRVTVTDDRWSDGEHPPSATLTVERAPDAEADHRVIPEQLYHRPHDALRRVLPYFEDGVERVVLRTDEHLAERAFENGTRTFSYEGTTYGATVERS